MWNGANDEKHKPAIIPHTMGRPEKYFFKYLRFLIVPLI